jgi:putative DNA primase/helicase
LVHHTGKNESRGLRGHSSLFAALDAALEVSRDGERRSWKVAKSKDGEDGGVHPFRLHVEMLGVDEYGDVLTSCSVLPDQTAQAVRRVKLPQGGNQRIAFDALIPMFKTCGKPGKAGAPPLSPCLELDIAIRTVASALPVETARKTERARASITGLTSRGLLACNEGWLWQV